MNSHYERALTTNQSMDIVEESIHSLNLRAINTFYGIDLKTYCCQLIDDHHKLIFYGFGKGLGLQSKVSAYYEALEHYVLNLFARNIANCQSNYIKMNAYEYKVPCVNLINIHSDEKISYPIYMLDPRYSKYKSKDDRVDYSSYSYLANDSGIASGTNMTEASIHALNELIERDAHSLFLIEAFIKNKNQHIKLIDKTTLPDTQKEIVKKIEQQYDDQLMIFDITSDINISVIYVSMTKQPFLIQPSGCGASLRSEYALERALLETLQPVHVANDKLIDNQLQIMKQLNQFPLLLKAAIANVMTLQDTYEIVDFKNLIDHDMNLTLTDQLNIIIQKIKAIGCQIFKLPIIKMTSGFTCVKFLIPEFEQFHLIQTGKRLLPNQRGMRLLSK